MSCVFACVSGKSLSNTMNEKNTTTIEYFDGGKVGSFVERKVLRIKIVTKGVKEIAKERRRVNLRDSRIVYREYGRGKISVQHFVCHRIAQVP